MKKLFFIFCLLISSVVNAENIKLFIHSTGGEPQKYALSLKSAMQKDGVNLIIETSPGPEMSGVFKSFKNEKGPVFAIVSGTTLAKGIKTGKYKLEDYNVGSVLFFSEIGLSCKVPCQFKNFEDVIGTTDKKIKIGHATALTKNLVEELRKNGVKTVSVPYSGGWPEMSPDLMSGALDLIAIITVDRRNTNITTIKIPEKYGIQSQTWMAILYKNVPQQRFEKWYNDESFVKEMGISKTTRDTNYGILLKKTVENIQ